MLITLPRISNNKFTKDSIHPYYGSDTIPHLKSTQTKGGRLFNLWKMKIGNRDLKLPTNFEPETALFCYHEAGTLR
jgi:hypothetical protein